ncbi:MAG: glycosyltransferase family 4 protein, partial [Candidatus Kapaibacterium sp.]
RLYRIFTVLKDLGFEVEFIDDLRSIKHVFLKPLTIYYKKIKSQNYHVMRETLFAKSMGSIINKKLKCINPDIIVTPGSLEASYIETDKPVIIWTDAIFSGLLDYYDSYKNLPPRNIRYGHILEERGLNNASLIVVPSNWARDIAIRDNKIPKEKIHVIEFGPGLQTELKRDEIFKLISDKDYSKLKILFTGTDWYRKGCDLTYHAIKQLNSEGINTEFIIAGMDDKKIPYKDNFIKCTGFLRKSDPDEKKKLIKLFLNAHFFVMPSRAEAFGISFIEANSFGLPVIGAKSGGMTTLIKDGINGFTINPENGINEIKAILKKYYHNRQDYIELSIGSYDEFSNRLNWQTAGERFYNLMKEKNII